MAQKQMTFIQAICCVLLLEFGNSVVVGVNITLGQDSWIVVIGGALLALPFLLMYARLLRLHPGVSFFDIIDRTLGRIAGKILSVIVCWYALHLCALVLRNFSEFMVISALQQTPQLPIMILILLVSIYLARSGYRTMGKWSIVTAITVVGIVAFTIALCIPTADFSNLLPVFAHSMPQMIQGSVDVAVYPYLDVVLFLYLGDFLCKGDSQYKLFLYSMLLALVIFLLIVTRNIVLLGANLMGMEYFPSYVAARVVNLGNVLPRMEGLISTNFILAGIVKIAVCLLVAAKSLSYVFKIENTTALLMPAGMFALALAATLYPNAVEMFSLTPMTWLYFLPFQVFIPLAVWIAGEIKNRKKRDALPKPRRGSLADSTAAK